jgi:nucleoside-diphosphate-sugar epimerase
MVIGSGLIASALSKFTHVNDYVFFCSGVSNSLETDVNKFDREIMLMNESISNLCRDQKFFYFSTFNLFDPTLKENSYVKHKIEIERKLWDIHNCYVIRLPIVIANSSNPNTLINFFRNSILNNEEVSVFSGSVRYLLDIEDLVQGIDEVLFDFEKVDKVINLAYPEPMSVKDVFSCIEFVMNKKGKIKLIEKGTEYIVNDIYPIEKFRYDLNVLEYLKKSLQKLT